MIVVIDYECGNVGSITNMLKYIAVPAVVSRDEEVIMKADGLVLPGVGSFDVGMEKLRGFGLDLVLERAVREAGIPILGICLGAQLMTLSSEEGEKRGLGWVDVETVKFDFPPGNQILPVPHMGWNSVGITQPGILTNGLAEDPRFYFVHSFHFKCLDEKLELLNCCYGYHFAAAFIKGNIVGVQFHPEKSHKNGIMLMKSFTALCKERSHV